MSVNTVFQKRRADLLKKIPPHALVLVPTAPIAIRNGDYEYPYRPHSDFYYLTGFEEPEAIAVLAPKRKEGDYLLFNRPRHREREIWDGPRAGQVGACRQYGAKQAFPIAEFAERLPSLLIGRKAVYYLFGINKNVDDLLLSAYQNLRGRVRSGIHFPTALIDLGDLLHEQRLIKGPAEIRLMRKAADISAAAHIRAMKACKPGVFEYQLEAELLHEFQSQGARYPAYTSIVGSDANTCILHYNANNQSIKNGSMVLIDAGCEYQGYAADITRTFPANGRFNQEQRAIYNLVLKAQMAVIKLIKPGLAWNKMHETALRVLTQGLIDLGLLRGRLKDLLAKQAYLPFYMHRTGHWLGLDVHDAGLYALKGKWRKLQAGMVLTVEPGLYISSNLKKVPKRWHNIGVRIEDDVLVTATGCEVLSRKAPKTIADIEALMA